MADKQTTTTDGQQPGATTPIDGGKTFTQAELDRVVKERLEWERGKYSDYDDLKAAAKKLKDLETSQLSETEKRDKRIQELEAAKQKWEAEAETRERGVAERVIRSEVRMVAGVMGFASPDDAYHLAELTEVQLDGDGNVQGVEAALKKLAKDKPYLLKGATAGPGSPPNEPKGKKGSAEDDWIAEAQRRFGIKKVQQPGG